MDSWHAFPPAQAPLANETCQSKPEDRGRMPDRHSPGIHDRGMPLRQTSSELIQLAGRDYFAAGFFGDGFEQRKIRGERTEFLGSEVRAPASFGAPDFGSYRIGHDC